MWAATPSSYCSTWELQGPSPRISWVPRAPCNRPPVLVSCCCNLGQFLGQFWSVVEPILACFRSSVGFFLAQLFLFQGCYKGRGPPEGSPSPNPHFSKVVLCLPTGRRKTSLKSREPGCTRHVEMSGTEAYLAFGHEQYIYIYVCTYIYVYIYIFFIFIFIGLS